MYNVRVASCVFSALFLWGMFACSDDVYPADEGDGSFDVFDINEPDSLDVESGDATVPEDVNSSDVGDVTQDSDANEDTNKELSPAEYNVCEFADVGTDPTSCPIQQATDFGDCDDELGVVFDGTQCVRVTGCGCEGDDCPRFDTLEECATACAQAGFCQAERLPAILTGACPGESCFDLTTICAAPSGELTDFEAFLDESLPGLNIFCSESSDLCGVAIYPHTCRSDDWCCTISGPYTFDVPRHQSHCAITLLPIVRALGCLPLD